MATCPNKNLSSWKSLVAAQGEDNAHYLWDKYEGNVPEYYNTSLNDKLVDGFLKDFGITATEYNDLKSDIGVDAITASDLITKAIAYKKGETVTPEVAYFAYSMLGKQNNKLRSELRFLVNKWNKYQERFDYHKKALADREGFNPDKDKWKAKIRDLVILDFLQAKIEDHYLNPTAFVKNLDSKWTREDFNLWNKIVSWFEGLLSSYSKKYASQKERLNNLGIAIADEVLNNNYEYFDYGLSEDQIRKYYNRTIESDPFAKELVEFGQKELGIVLTGSLALRRAGEVYRTADETLHDIDWVIPFELNNSEENKSVLSQIENFQGGSPSDSLAAGEIAQKFDWFKKFKEKYPSFKVTNQFYGAEHNKFESLTLQGVIDAKYYTEDGTHEETYSYYTKDKDTKKPVKVTKTTTVSHEAGDMIPNTGYAIDFFVRLQPNQEQHENYFKLWKEIMIAKLQMGRDKDFSDWKAFVPYLKSKDNFNFNYEGFRHFNYETSENNAFDDTVQTDEQLYLQTKGEVERAVEGFNLRPITRPFGISGYTTKNDKITMKIVKEMQEWFDDHRNLYPSIYPVWNRTYNVINFRDRVTKQEVQLSDMPMSVASEETLALVKELATKMGIKISDLVTYANETGLKVDGINGVADLIRGIVAVAEGKEGSALTEEMVHIATAIIESIDPKIVTEMISKIDRFKIYDQTLKAYKTDPRYQLANGKPDIRKIKKEAVDKLITELIVNGGANVEQYPELREEKNRSLVQKFFDAIIDFFSGRYKKANIDIFKTVAGRIKSGEVGGTVSDIKSKGVYQQKSSTVSEYTPAQAAIINKINEDDASLTKVERKTVDDRGKPIIKQIYVRNKDGVKKDVANRVTDIVRKKSEDKGFDEENLSTEERTFNAFKRDIGIEKHKTFEDIHARYFDENGVKRENPLPVPEFKSKEEEETYYKLEKYFTDLIELHPDAIFLSEKKMYDPKTDTAGTMDLLVIDPNGKANIYDWKFGTVSKDAEDIAWYKQSSYNVQLGQYKLMLADVYGVKEFGKMRAIPIVLKVKSQNKKDGSVQHKLTGIAIGTADSTKTSNLLLTPISEETESTGDEVIDDHISKLNSLAKRISAEKSDDENYDLKIERLTAVRKAVRLIQGQNNLSGIIEAIQTLKNQGAKILDDYNAIYKDRPASSEDSTNKELSEFSRQMREYIDAAELFDRVEVELGDRIYTEQLEEDIDPDDEEGQAYIQELKDVLIDLTKQSNEIFKAKNEIKKIMFEFGSKHLGERNLVTGLTEAEAVPKGLAAGFKDAFNFGIRSINIMAKLNLTARSNAKATAEAGINKIMNIRKRIIARGDAESVISKIFSVDKDNNKVNKLVKKYDSKFREEFRDNAAADNLPWLEQNIDLDRVRKESEVIMNKKIDRIEKFYKNDDEKREAAILRVERAWDVDNPQFNGWKQNYLLQKYPLDKWYSSEYKAIQADPELRELYDYIESLNQEASSVGFIEKRIMDSFLPFVRKTVAEKVIEGNVLAPLTNFYDSLKMNPDDVGYGMYDEMTGKLMNALPKYYTYDFSRKADGPNDYSEVSFDLFANLILYTQEVEKYKYLSEIEDQISLLRTIETFKKNHIATDRSGNIIMENGKPKQAPGNEEILKDFDLFTRTLFYGQKYVMSDVDTPVGIGKAIVGVKKLINKVAGREVVKINEGDETPASLVKLMDAANRAFSLKTLSLDPLPGLVNLVGSQFQMSAQAGEYFSAEEFAKNEAKLLGHVFKSEEEKEMFAQLINKFVPLREDPSYEELKKSSIVKGGILLNGNNISDFLMIAFRKPEMMVEKSIFLSLLDNSMVENGKIVNIRQFVKAKYKDRYDSPEAFQNAKAKMDAEIEKLKETRSITNTKKLENGKLVIPGLDLNNKTELNRLSNQTRNTTNRVVGGMSQESTTKMDMSIWTKSMMVFKKWIYPLLETRFSGIHKLGADDFSTFINDEGMLEGEKYDLGRASLFLKLMYDSIKDRQVNIKNVLQVNEAGIKKLDDLYEHYSQQYYKKTGQPLNMSKADFADMIRQNVQSSLKEIAYIVALTAAAFALGFFAPDDDDDKAAKNRHRYYLRMLDKIRDEITFFYNPNEIRNIAAGGIFPAIAVVTDALTFFKHLSEQITGIPITGKKGRTAEQVRKDAMPVKDLLKNFIPGGKTVLTFGGVLSEDWAKEFDITIKAQNTVR
jgi:hypothetical protein